LNRIGGEFGTDDRFDPNDDPASLLPLCDAVRWACAHSIHNSWLNDILDYSGRLIADLVGFDTDSQSSEFWIGAKLVFDQVDLARSGPEHRPMVQF